MTATCPHLSVLDRLDGLTHDCPQSWTVTHTATIARPWWHVPADIVLLALTALVVIGCLVVGQQLQAERCAAQVGTAQACAGTVTR